MKNGVASEKHFMLLRGNAHFQSVLFDYSRDYSAFSFLIRSYKASTYFSGVFRYGRHCFA